jgi:hypothetical protein
MPISRGISAQEIRLQVPLKPLTVERDLIAGADRHRHGRWGGATGGTRSGAAEAQDAAAWRALGLPGLSHMTFAELSQQAGEERVIPSGALELALH